MISLVVAQFKPKQLAQNEPLYHWQNIKWHKSNRNNWHSLNRNDWHYNSEIIGTNRTELTINQKRQIIGGGEWYPGGCSNGGGMQWGGSGSAPSRSGSSGCSCDLVWKTQMTTNEFGWAYMLGWGDCSH